MYVGIDEDLNAEVQKSFIIYYKTRIALRLSSNSMKTMTQVEIL